MKSTGVIDHTAESTEQVLTQDELRKMDAYWRACNYLCAGMIYLRDNPLLREPLRPSTSRIGCLGTGAPIPDRPLPGFISIA